MVAGGRISDESPAPERAILLAALQAMDVGVVITDEAGHVEWVNEGFTRRTGYALEAIRGRTPSILKSGTQDAAFYEELWQTVLGGEVWNGELVSRAADGTLYPELQRVTPIVDGEGRRHFVAHRLDLTAQRQSELAAEAAEQRFQAAQRMEAIGLLASGVAHDFNNLLSVIHTFAELVRMGEEDPERLEDIDHILDAAKRAAGLTRQLLSFSRREARERVEHHSFDETVAQTLRLVRRVLPAGVELLVSLSADGALVHGQRARLDQILLNLLVNARDAVCGEGRIEIRTGRLVDGVFLEVEDDGCGMDEETRERIFDPLFTTKPEGRGTGLGLASVDGAVRHWGGRVSVESEPGRGSLFRVELPSSDGMPPLSVGTPLPSRREGGADGHGGRGRRARAARRDSRPRAGGASKPAGRERPGRAGVHGSGRRGGGRPVDRHRPRGNGRRLARARGSRAPARASSGLHVRLPARGAPGARAQLEAPVEAAVGARAPRGHRPDRVAVAPHRERHSG